jgi:hypothetical protein
LKARGGGGIHGNVAHGQAKSYLAARATLIVQNGGLFFSWKCCLVILYFRAWNHAVRWLSSFIIRFVLVWRHEKNMKMYLCFDLQNYFMLPLVVKCRETMSAWTPVIDVMIPAFMNRGDLLPTPLQLSVEMWRLAIRM